MSPESVMKNIQYIIIICICTYVYVRMYICIHIYISRHHFPGFLVCRCFFFKPRDIGLHTNS